MKKNNKIKLQIRLKESQYLKLQTIKEESNFASLATTIKYLIEQYE